ncbi:MAG: response regulator transcription factor [Bryobacterales bacterium]|nr:response regulator transcription factor [Bryobacterales bacterium]
MKRIRIVITDDHRLVANSLKAYLDSFPDIEVVGIATSGEELLRSVSAWAPGIVLQDLILPGGWDGLETTRRLLAQCPGVRVIALTATVDDARMAGILRVGASGYVRKDAEPETLLAAIRYVAAGGTFVDPSRAIQLARGSAPVEDLTPREMEVLRALAGGRSNRDIAASLFVSEETVKTHVGSILAKLRVENRAQAIVQALKRGLVALEDLEDT